MIHRLLCRVIAVIALFVCHASAQEIANEPRRETWQRVPEIFAAVGVRSGAVIADVGAGEGFLTVRLSAVVGPAGTVYAVDNVEAVASGLRTRLAASDISNVEVVVGTDTDPRLPVGILDGAVIVNAYHEMPPAVLSRIYTALKPGARLVLCEPTPSTTGQSRTAQFEDHVLDPALIVSDLREAGFVTVRREDRFATNLAGNHFSLVVAERPKR